VTLKHLLLAAGFLVLGSSVSTAAADFQAIRSGWTISCRSDDAGGGVVTAKPASGPEQRFAVTYSHVTDAAVWNNAVLVIVSETVGADAVTIISLTKGSIQDEFFAWEPAPSPDGRFIVYNAFYPRQSDYHPVVGLAYDVTRTAAENRMVATGPDALAFQSGWAFYPDFNRTQRSYDDRQQKVAGNGLALQSRFAWVDPTHVAFVVLAGDKSNVALVDLSKGVGNPAVAMRELDDSALVDVSRLAPGTAPASRLFVKSITATVNQARLTLTLSLVDTIGLKRPTVTVEF
jgi:hypothetical protein